MISRSTLIGALVVVELGIVGVATEAIAGGSVYRPPNLFGQAPFGLPEHGAPGAQTAGLGRLHRSFAAGPTPHVVIDIHDIDVTVHGDGGYAVQVDDDLRKSGWVSGDFPVVTVQQSLDTVRIAAESPEGEHFAIGSYERRVHITVPMTARLEVIGAGNMDVSALRSKLVAHIPAGQIHLRDHRGDVDISTGSGRITMVDVQGNDVAANTRDGRIYLTRVGADRLNGTSASGRIVGVDVRAVDGTLTTRDGRIILSFTGNSDATINAHTADGHVRVSGLPITESDEQRSVVRVGSGRGHFEVSTASGPISITPGASI